MDYFSFFKQLGLVVFVIFLTFGPLALMFRRMGGDFWEGPKKD